MPDEKLPDDFWSDDDRAFERMLNESAEVEPSERVELVQICLR